MVIVTCFSRILFTVVRYFRWSELRRGTAGDLLTKHMRMQVYRRKYTRARKGTVSYQALFRGFVTRRVLASIKLQRFVRMRRRQKNFLMLKSATIALQCRIRERIAKKVLKELKREQGDIGKLKQNNEKLKTEMQSLKAMLAAQAKEDAAGAVHKKELEAKQAEVARLEKRVQELEKELAEEKATIEKLEADINSQAKEIARLQEPASPRSPLRHSSHHRKRTSSVDNDKLAMPDLPEDFVSPHVLAQHKAHLRKLEEELKAERKHRREADGEIIKLRAQISGVELKADDVDALLAKKLESAPPPPPPEERKIERYVLLKEVTSTKRIPCVAMKSPRSCSHPLTSRKVTISLILALIANLLIAGQLLRKRSRYAMYQKALQFIDDENLSLDLLFSNETGMSESDLCHATVSLGPM
jgi:myosin heavy subunit